MVIKVCQNCVSNHFPEGACGCSCHSFSNPITDYEAEKIEREKLTYRKAKQMLIASRGVLVEMLDLALKFGDIKQRERDILYFRMIDWHSLEETGKKFGLTRERIRQIEAKVDMIMENLTENKNTKISTDEI